MKKVGGVELAWGKYQSGCKYQGESESESESMDVWKDVRKVGGKSSPGESINSNMVCSFAAVLLSH